MNSQFKKKCVVGATSLFIIAIFVPALALAFPPDAGRPFPGPGQGMHRPQMSPFGLWRISEIIKDLKLTEDQVSKLKEADFACREKNQQMMAELGLLELKMEKAFSTVPADRRTASELAKKIAVLKGKMFVFNIESRLDFETILTPQQLEKLRASFRPPPCPRQPDRHKGKPPREAGPGSKPDKK